MKTVKGLWRYPFTRIAVTAIVLTMLLAFGGLPLAHNATGVQAAGSSSCHLNSPGGKIQHVIHIQFDNTHFTRDNPNVPSDLEQMPNLLNFMENNGVLLSNHHTPLIAHTATDILTTLTGVYGDRHGQPISNSYRYFNPNGTSNPAVSFAYWTAPLYDYSTSTPTDTTYTMLTANGKNAPAPWVPYTRTGCNFGAVATANTILENTAIDIPTVFGAGSPEAKEAAANADKATADFVGIGVHCAQGNAVCTNSSHARPDLLPAEPGGYTGYKGLFGNKYVAPQISPNGPVTDLNGNVLQYVAKSGTYTGFPGFDGMTASASLAYVADMQEHGVPVTYAYISDAHDNHMGGGAYGPGQAGYVSALASYNDAFGKFFARLKADGIDQSNTLFVFTADEGDHFVGGAPGPANCNGVTIPCTYSQIGEINANLAGLLATEKNNTTPFAVHSDSAPNFYITGNPAQTASVTRQLERDVSQLTAVNPLTGNTDTITRYMADQTEMRILHMITADPARTPNFTMFADPNYYLYAGAPNCATPCVSEQPGFAWNHGTVSPDINTTWLGIVGPGVKHMGVNGTVWSDHTDTRPTMLELLGLKDDYSHDGRVLFEVIDKSALPPAVRANLNGYIALAQVYKQLDACVGLFGLTTLQVSTAALESNSTNDATYTQLESELQTLNTQRDTIAGQMIAILESAEFGGKDAGVASQGQSLISQGNGVMAHAKSLVKK